MVRRKCGSPCHRNPATGRAYEPPGWTEWYGSLDPTTLSMYNTVFSVDGVPTLFHSSGQEIDPDNLPNPLPPAGAANYQTHVIEDLSLRFLDRHGVSSAPLFLSVSTLAPHVEFCDWSYAKLRDVGPIAAGAPHPFTANIDPVEEGGQGYRGLFLESTRPAPPDLVHLDRLRRAAAGVLFSFPSFDEADVSDKPSFIRSRAVSIRAPYTDAPNGEPGDRYPYLFDADLFEETPAAFNRDLSLTSPWEQASSQAGSMMATMAAFDRMIGGHRGAPGGAAPSLEHGLRADERQRLFARPAPAEHQAARVRRIDTRSPFTSRFQALTGGPLRSWGMVLHTDVARALLDLASAPGAPARLRFAPDGTSLKGLLLYPDAAMAEAGID